MTWFTLSNYFPFLFCYSAGGYDTQRQELQRVSESLDSDTFSISTRLEHKQLPKIDGDAVGLDLGSKLIKIAVQKKGEKVINMVVFSSGKREISVCLAFPKGNPRLVGSIAVDQVRFHPDRAFLYTPRLLGCASEQIDEFEKQHLSYTFNTKSRMIEMSETEQLHAE